MNVKRKILVIDDDPTVCNIISQTLEARGFEVFTAAGPEEGVEKAKEIEPNLIFISLILPSSNGLKTSKSIRSIENLDKTPVIMLISYAGELDPRYTVTIGIVDVIVKPPNPEELVSKTMNILGEDTVSSEIEEISQESPVEEEFEAFSIEEEISDFEGKEAELIRDTSESLETLEEKITEPAEDHDIHELFDESSKQDIKQVYEPEDLGIKAEDYADKELDEGRLEEEYDISDKQIEKDDELKEMLAEEEEAHKDAESTYFDEFESAAATKKSPRKKIILIVASLVIIVGLGIGVFQIKKIFYPDTGKEIPSSYLEEVPEKKEPVQKETIKEVVPPATIDKPESVSRKPSSPQKAKALKKNVYSVQVGAFGNEKNAISFADKLKQKGYDAFIQKDVTADQKTIHRVLIGKFNDNKKALEHSRIILQKEGIKSFIFHN